MLSKQSIRAIDKGAVHKICSGQVVLDLSSAVKELVENALDAGATNVEVRLKEYGSEMIEVADNGNGISPSDYHALTLKYHTSKLQEFADLQNLKTFGFRGEALSSLCALADLSVITRQVDQTTGTKLEFDSNGAMKAQSAAARSQGTTICLKQIFKPLPVRYKEFKRNVKREFAKMINLLQAYALISTGVRIICTNQTGSGSRGTVVSTQMSTNLRDNIVMLFGSKTADGLQPLEASAGPNAHFSGFISKGSMGMSRATGDRQFLFLNNRPIDLPKANKVINESFRSLASPALASHKPMFVINIKAGPSCYDVNVTPDKRKVFLQDERELLETLQQILTGIWEPTRSRYQIGSNVATLTQKKVGQKRSLAEAADNDSEEEGESSDEDIECDLQNEDPAPKVSSIATWSVRELRQSMCFGRRSKPVALAAFQRGSGGSGSGSGGREEARSLNLTSRLSRRPPAASPLQSQPLISRFICASSKDGTASRDEGDADSEQSDRSDKEQENSDLEAVRSNFGAAIQHTESRPASPSLAVELEGAEKPPSTDEDDSSEKSGPAGLSPIDPPDAAPSELPNISDENETLQPSAKRLRLSANVDPDITVKAEVHSEETLKVNKLEKLDPGQRSDSTSSQLNTTFSVQDLSSRWQQYRARVKSPGRSSSKVPMEVSALQVDAEEAMEDGAKAEAELGRIFEKASFRQLKIVGQFNLGFILARLGRDLFIIDQHASDEKHNFERLSRTTHLNRQPLLVPQPLDLTPSEAIVVRENMHVFTQNGFEVAEGRNGDLVLTGIPYSQNMSFGKSDVQELAQLLAERGAPQPDGGLPPPATPRATVVVSEIRIRPSRVRAMLAMRACRSSIMIGKSLDAATMRRVVDNLADLESPWNCPHGRPTMRHLAVLPAGRPHGCSHVS